MKRLAIVTLCGLLGLAASAHAEPTLSSILDGIYGIGNYAPVIADQIWGDLDGSVQVQAKYAGDNHKFGYSTDEVAGTGPVWFNGGANDPIFDGTDMDTFDIVPNTDLFIWALYDINTTQTFYSRNSLNPDMADHMHTFEILTMADTYVVAWEDRTFPGADGDYNDLVVEVSNARPIPAPGAIALGSLGIALAGWLKRRRSL